MPHTGPNAILSQGFPGSPDPYNPVNPWGRKPDFTRAHTCRPVQARDLRQAMSVPLYQCMVDDEKGEPQPVGPALEKGVIAAMVFPGVARLMKAGRLRGWSNLRVELVTIPDVSPNAGASRLIMPQ